jgi:2-keto-4-pentenoate hydratase/2-oxohepta-3-ene-1,7-dioic acid hydratase in catechol pathway
MGCAPAKVTTRIFIMTQSRRSVIVSGGAALGLGMGVAGMASSSRAGADPGVQAHPAKLTYANIHSSTGKLGLALRTTRGVLDVAALERARRLGLPTTITDVIQKRGDLAALGALATSNATHLARYYKPESEVSFGPVVSSAPKIICVGLNYRAHAAEGGAEVPKEPILFNKFDSCLNHHGGTIPVSRQHGSQWDYEAELVMIIGRGGSDIPQSEALSHVFGYCNGNDFSERARQRVSAQWMLGKAGDGWGPLGPWLVSADQINPENLDLKCIVNGEVRQSANTREMIFDCKTLISYISQQWALQPGDVIFTGTCEGTIIGYPPDKRIWLKPGDKITSSIEKLGSLDFTLT